MITNDTLLHTRIPAALHEQLRVAAFERRKSMSEIVREALELNLAQDSNGDANARRAG